MFSLEQLEIVRQAEIERIAAFFPPGARVLEIGAGTGQQAREIARRGFSVEAIDIPGTNYAEARVFPIIDFDGRNIPFDGAAFDVVFSSNVLEHVRDLEAMHAEISRVLRPDGRAIHVLPTHAWRFWTTVAAFPAAFQNIWALSAGLIPPPSLSRHRWATFLRSWFAAARRAAAPFFQRRHGERGTVITELWLFHPRWWRRRFRADGFAIVGDEPMGLFYTGHSVIGGGWSLQRRQRLARVLGSACHVFHLVPRARM